METNKIDIIREALIMFKKKTEQEVKECEEKMQNEELSSEDLLQEGMYGCYLNGVLKCLETVIGVLDNEMLDKLIEKLEEISSKDNIAKA